MTVFEAVLRLHNSGYSFRVQDNRVYAKRVLAGNLEGEKAMLALVASRQEDAALAIEALPRLCITGFKQGSIEPARLGMVKAMQTEGYIKIIRIIYHWEEMTVDFIYTPEKDPAFSRRLFEQIGGVLLESQTEGQPGGA